LLWPAPGIRFVEHRQFRLLHWTLWHLCADIAKANARIITFKPSLTRRDVAQQVITCGPRPRQPRRPACRRRNDHISSLRRHSLAYATTQWQTCRSHSIAHRTARTIVKRIQALPTRQALARCPQTCTNRTLGCATHQSTALKLIPQRTTSRPQAHRCQWPDAGNERGKRGRCFQESAQEPLDPAALLFLLSLCLCALLHGQLHLLIR
jgi:hypothetical protein